MQHAHAVDLIYDLIPKMASSSPEDVMLKYATDNNLAPEQLAKVARVFNSCSTLHQLSKDRNGQPFLVDPPSLVRGYIEKTAKSKLDLNDSFLFGTKPDAPLAKAASAAPVERDTELPGIWKAARVTPVAEVEVVEVPEHEQYRRWKMDLSSEAKRCMKLAEDFSQGIEAHAADMRKLAQDLGRKSYSTEIEWANELRKDAHGYLHDHEVESAFSMLEKLSGELGISTERWEKGASKDLGQVILHRDRTGYIPQLTAAVGKLKSAAALMADFEESLERLFVLKEAKWTATDRAAQDTLRLVAQEVRAVSFITEKEANAQRIPRVTDSAAGDFDALNNSLFASDKGDWSSLAHAVNLPIHARRDLVGGLGESFDWSKDFIKELGPQGGLATALGGTAAENHKTVAKNQLNLGRVAEDTRSMATLQKLMMTDDIIGSKPPEQVVEAYNTIRMASPEVAADPSMVRILLRNALETQGVDIDSAGAARKFTEDKRKNDLSAARQA